MQPYVAYRRPVTKRQQSGAIVFLAAVARALIWAELWIH